MKPYGNDHSYRIDHTNNTRDRPNATSGERQHWRRATKKITRAKAKAALRREARRD